MLLLVLYFVNLHKKIHIKSSNLSVSCDDKAGQLKHCIWQLLSLLLYWGC